MRIFRLFTSFLPRYVKYVKNIKNNNNMIWVPHSLFLVRVFLAKFILIPVLSPFNTYIYVPCTMRICNTL